MIRASSLYIVIIIALVIAMICSAMISTAYYYRLSAQQKQRYDRLGNNLESGTALILAADAPYARNTAALFSEGTDSVITERISWGAFDIGIVVAFLQKDSLARVFSLASGIDSARWAALYVPDEDRALSVSGKTRLEGNAYLPKAGVRKAFMDRVPYEGADKVVGGHTYVSERKLPPLNPEKLQQMRAGFHAPLQTDTLTSLRGVGDTNSFFRPTRHVFLSKKDALLSGTTLSGNIILHSDSLLIIDSTCHLENVLVYAPAILIKRGFSGTCQLFCTDSLTIEPGCHFNYPSCAGLLTTGSAGVVRQPGRITMGDSTTFNGLMFTSDPSAAAEARTSVRLGHDMTLTGQLYTAGIVLLQDGVRIHGSVFAGRFLYQLSSFAYENYLVNIEIDSKKLSPYYLCSPVLPVASKTKKNILQWLNAK